MTARPPLDYAAPIYSEPPKPRVFTGVVCFAAGMTLAAVAIFSMEYVRADPNARGFRAETTLAGCFELFLICFSSGVVALSHLRLHRREFPSDSLRLLFYFWFGVLFELLVHSIFWLPSRWLPDTSPLYLVLLGAEMTALCPASRFLFGARRH